MLAIILSVEKFNDETFARTTIAHTDHKPLERIFPRVYKLSWNLKLSMWRTFSRKALQIHRETEKGESLQILKAVIQQGRPDDKSALLPVASPYFDMRDEMSV